MQMVLKSLWSCCDQDCHPDMVEMSHYSNLRGTHPCCTETLLEPRTSQRGSLPTRTNPSVLWRLWMVCYTPPGNPDDMPCPGPVLRTMHFRNGFLIQLTIIHSKGQTPLFSKSLDTPSLPCGVAWVGAPYWSCVTRCRDGMQPTSWSSFENAAHSSLNICLIFSWSGIRWSTDTACSHESCVRVSTGLLISSWCTGSFGCFGRVFIHNGWSYIHWVHILDLL